MPIFFLTHPFYNEPRDLSQFGIFRQDEEGGGQWGVRVLSFLLFLRPHPSQSPLAPTRSEEDPHHSLTHPKSVAGLVKITEIRKRKWKWRNVKLLILLFSQFTNHHLVLYEYHHHHHHHHHTTAFSYPTRILFLPSHPISPHHTTYQLVACLIATD